MLAMRVNTIAQQDPEARALTMLLEKNECVFADYAEDVIRTTPMRITLESNRVPKVRLRRQSPENILEIKKQVENMLQRGIIEPSVSQYSANCHLVPKKTGQKRIVINYIPLNHVARKGHYPLPQVSDLLAHLAEAKLSPCTHHLRLLPKWQVKGNSGNASSGGIASYVCRKRTC